MSRGAIIVLEDDQDSILVFRAALAAADFQCVEASTTEEVLDACRSWREELKALVTDLYLPTCRGTDVALAACALRPELPVLFVSTRLVGAWPVVERRKLADLPAGRTSFIAKPFRNDAFIRKLDELIGP